RQDPSASDGAPHGATSGLVRAVWGQAEAPRGGGSALRGGGEDREGARCRFRQGSRWENERPGPEQVNASGGGRRGGGGHFRAASDLGARSAGELGERAEQVLVGRVGVDGGRGDGLVPREPLREADVARGAVEVGAGRVAQGVEAEGPIEAGALLPLLEGVAQLPGREPVALAGH